MSELHEQSRGRIVSGMSIAVIGDSVATSYASGQDAAFPELLGRELDTAMIQSSVVSFAESGLGLKRALEEWKRVVDLDPSILVLALGGREAMIKIDHLLKRLPHPSSEDGDLAAKGGFIRYARLGWFVVTRLISVRILQFPLQVLFGIGPRARPIKVLQDIREFAHLVAQSQVTCVFVLQHRVWPFAVHPVSRTALRRNQVRLAQALTDQGIEVVPVRIPWHRKSLAPDGLHLSYAGHSAVASAIANQLLARRVDQGQEELSLPT